MAAWIKMSFGMELRIGPGDFVLDGDPAPSPKRGQSPSAIFGPFLLWPNGWMHQDATSTEVGLSPGDFVLHGDPAACTKGAEPHPIFASCIAAKRLDGSRCP